MDLRGALGRMMQAFEGRWREPLLKALTRLGPDGEYIAEVDTAHRDTYETIHSTYMDIDADTDTTTTTNT